MHPGATSIRGDHGRLFGNPHPDLAREAPDRTAGAPADRCRHEVGGGDGLPDGEELSDADGVLQARAPDDQGRLARLVAEALPTSGAVPVSGSMQLGRVSGLPPFVVHIKPVGVPQPDYGARPVAALVLIVEPGRHPRLDSALVARTLRLTPAESQVAALLADGKTVRDIALATGRRESTIRSHVKHMFAKHGLSRQADLVRLVLSLASAQSSGTDSRRR